MYIISASLEELLNSRIRFPTGLDFNASEPDTSMDEGRDVDDDEDDDFDNAPRTNVSYLECVSVCVY